ncbi:MAG: 50S ribosomal protein L32 [Chitinophagales bacterium]|nr:50S ribosomal protein L32 [Chitinophagales bacterium]
MPNPKRKHSKQRRDKRRTHDKAALPNVVTDKTTGEYHLFHRAFQIEGDLYYKGKLFIQDFKG